MSQIINKGLTIVKRVVATIWGFLKWLAVALMIGLFVGGVGCIFHFAVTGALELRESHKWLIFLLPIGGLFITGIYHLARIPDPKGTDLILESIQDEGTEPPAVMAPLIFISTTVTHLVGGSSGREGAALQIGGSLGNLIGHLLRFDEKSKNILIMCGMSAAFTSLFGTPMAATIFAMELISVGVMYYAALVPCAISSVVAYELARKVGIEEPAFHILKSPSLEADSVIKVLILSMLCAGISVIFCFLVQKAGKYYKQFFQNGYLRTFVSGLLILGFILLCRTQEYVGLGMDSIKRAICDGVVKPEAFFLKIVFTALTLGGGFKGGEIVPAFFVGATFGCLVGPVLGLPPSFAAAVGLIAVFCGVTNCPMTALVLSFEMFSYAVPLLFLVVVAVSYMLSGYYSLYSTQRILYDKLRPQYINRKPHSH